jgi:hypothetical protein
MNGTGPNESHTFANGVAWTAASRLPPQPANFIFSNLLQKYDGSPKVATVALYRPKNPVPYHSQLMSARGTTSLAVGAAGQGGPVFVDYDGVVQEPMSDAGSYTVKAREDPGPSSGDGSGSDILIIQAADQAPVAVGASSYHVLAGQAVKLLPSGGSGDGAYGYQVTSSSATYALVGDMLSFTSGGSVTLSAYRLASSPNANGIPNWLPSTLSPPITIVADWIVLKTSWAQDDSSTAFITPNQYQYRASGTGPTGQYSVLDSVQITSDRTTIDTAGNTWVFGRWALSGVSGDPTNWQTVVTLTSPMGTAVAHYYRPDFRLYLGQTGNGGGTVGCVGYLNRLSDGAYICTAGSTVSLTATAYSDSWFYRWDPVSALASPTSITMTHDQTMNAWFVKKLQQYINISGLPRQLPVDDNAYSLPPCVVTDDTASNAAAGLPVPPVLPTMVPTMSVVSGPGVLVAPATQTRSGATEWKLQVTGLGPIQVHVSVPGDAYYLPASMDFTITGTPPPVSLKVQENEKTILNVNGGPGHYIIHGN